MDYYKHNCSIYLKFLQLTNTEDHFIPVSFSAKNYKIVYELKGLESIRNYLNKYPSQLNLILNELFAFIGTFQKYSFVHGNLNIDNIYVNKYLEFRILDFSHSMFIDEPCYTDFFTVYTSVMFWIDSKNKNLHKYKSLLLDLIKIHFVSNDQFVSTFNKYINYNRNTI